MVVPTVFKNLYSLAIIEGNVWCRGGKKFNLDAIGMEARREISERDGETSVRGVVSVDKESDAVEVPEEERIANEGE